jgi:gas vesicle protein
MPAERVVIDIEVNSDIATIVATRRALEDLTDAQRRYNRERDREPRGGGGGDDSGGGGGGGRRRRGGGGGGGSRARGRYDGLGGQVFDFRGDVGKMISMYGTLLKLVNKLAMISLPLMAGVLGSISLLFKMGTYFVNMYRAAMSSMATAVGFAYVALTTLLAAQREFSAVQNSPSYIKGSLTTNDRFVAAGQAMSMFVGNSELAVVSAKSLQSSFTTLSKVSPITGKTTAAFTSLMDVVAGSGGDLDKGTEKLATFLAEVQKKGTLAGGAEAAKDLGPDFEKIVKEASALGIKTSEEFLKAAAEGKLGETFATKYAGTLDALNNTVMGRFKGAISSIKEQLTDLGGEYLGETGGAISRLQGIVSAFITRLSFVLRDFDAAGEMGSFLDKVEKGADKLIVLMNRYLGTTPGIFEFFGDSFTNIGNAFDAMQDWMRQFQKAGELINKHFFKPLFNSMGDSFTLSMQDLAGVIEGNAPLIESFATQISNTLVAIGKYGDMLRRLFLSAIPFFNALLKLVEVFFKGLDKFGEAALKIGDIFDKLGPLGRLAGQLVRVAALYALFTIATRFFKVFGTMFGKKIPAMNVQAGVVNVNGGVVPGLGGGLGGSGGRGGRLGRALSRVPGGGRLASVARGTASVGSRLASSGVMAPLAIAGGSYMAASKISGLFKDDSVKSRGMSAGASALAGAGIGAAIGSFIPVIGTGIGAAIGAAIGGVTGYIKAGKQRKETRKAAEGLLTNFSETIDQAIAGGNVDDLLQARTDLISERNKLISENADPAYAAQAVAKYDEQFEKLNKNIDNYTSNVGLSEKYFDTGAESLNKLAETAGIDLKDKMLNFRDVLQLVGKTAEDQARLLKAAWSGFTAGIVNPVFDFFDKQAQEREQFKAVNAAAEKLQGGDAGIESRQDFLKKALQYNVGQFGDVQGLMNTFAQLELELAQGGKFANLTDEQKAGLRNDLRLAGGSPETILKNVDFAGLAELSGGLNNMGGLLNKEGFVDPKKLETLITSQMKTNPLFLQQFTNAASNPDKVKAGSDMNTLLKGTGFEGAGTSGVSPDRMVPPGQGTQNYVAQTTINAAMLDKGTVDQIERAIAKALKEQRERGMVPATGGTIDQSRS